MNRKEKLTALKASFSTKTFRVGGYSLAAALIVIAIAVAAVLAVGALPSRYTQLDMSEEGYFSLSPQTEELLGGLTENVEICLLAVSGSEDPTLDSLIDRYAGLSERISVRHVDPVANPTFAQQYTDSLRYNNSVVVISGERSRFVDYTDIYITDYGTYYYTGDQSSITSSFNGEGALTSAIDYVTRESLPRMYLLEGHGEAPLTSSVAQSIAAGNITTEPLSLLTVDAVPTDCDCLFIHSPTTDIPKAEVEKIRHYLDEGGKLLLLTNYSDAAFPNLLQLMEGYGCSLTEGIVIEQDPNHYIYGYYDCLLPDIGSHSITAPLSTAGLYVVVPDAQGILVSDTLPEGVSVTKLLTTSQSSYAITDMSSIEKQPDAPEGPFAAGVAITRGESQIVWYSTGLLLNDSYNQAFGGANSDLFLNSIHWMCAQEDSITIHAKSLDSESLTLTTRQVARMGALVCLVIPMVFVLAGAAVIIRRRRMT